MGYGSKDIKNIVKEILEEKKDIGGIKKMCIRDRSTHGASADFIGRSQKL